MTDQEVRQLGERMMANDLERYNTYRAIRGLSPVKELSPDQRAMCAARLAMLIDEAEEN